MIYHQNTIYRNFKLFPHKCLCLLSRHYGSHKKKHQLPCYVLIKQDFAWLLSRLIKECKAVKHMSLTNAKRVTGGRQQSKFRTCWQSQPTLFTNCPCDSSGRWAELNSGGQLGGGGRESARTDQKLYSAFLAEKGKNERQNTPFFL